MATIKLQNGKVITKDGKVSCTCCEAGECCMYPAQALVDGLYSANDLPDSVDIINVDIVNELELNRSGAQYFGTTGGYTYKISIGNYPETPDDKYWALDVSFNGGAYGRVTESLCLISYPYPRPDTPVQEVGGFKDQFADTYTVSGNPDFNQTVARTSLGFWIGEGTGVQESNATVFYMRCSDLRIGYSESDWDAWWMTLGASDTIAKKTGDQNTPEGSYPFGDIIGTMTVS